MIWTSKHIGSATVSILDVDLLAADAAQVSVELGVDRLVAVTQVHGADVVRADDVESGRTEADAIVVDSPGVAAVIRVADCTPLALVDPERPLAAVIHAGRAGLVAGVVPATVRALRDSGAERLTAVLGPRVCGGCYELPAELVDDVASVVPAARATTSWGTPSIDVGAGVIAQLEEDGIEVVDMGVGQCTVENHHWFSYRRQGDAAGRFGMAVVIS